MSLHPTLLRQLRRLGLDRETPPDPVAWTLLLERVSAAYVAADDDHYLQERSLAISSREMRDLYGDRAAAEARQAALREVATAVAAGHEPVRVGGLALNVVAALVAGAEVTLRWVSEAEAADPPREMPDQVRDAVTGGVPVRREIGDLTQLVVPAVAAGRVRAVIVALVGDRADEAVQLLTDIADLVALSVVNSEATERLTTRAATDPLTGLANHRVFQERLDTEVRRAMRHGRALSLLVGDLDEFKQVNDTHGHQAGDLVLVEVAHRLATIARSHDLPARIGGEEFAIVLPETDGMGAYDLAERLRALVAETPIEPAGRVTISIGVCALADSEGAQDLMRRADSALFWAKANGRNMAFRWTPENAAQLRHQDGEQRADRIRALTAVRSLARAVDDRSPFTRRHSDRVADIAHALALEMGWTAGRAAALRQAALVHDVGKVGLPEDLLLVREALMHGGRRVVAAHTTLGAAIVGALMEDEQVAWIRGHHERIDGTGYPDGLSGLDIPDGARILAVADTWDAVTSERPHRAAMTPAEALAECRSVAGAQLCREAVEAIERLHASSVLEELVAGGGEQVRSQVPWA